VGFEERLSRRRAKLILFIKMPLLKRKPTKPSIGWSYRMQALYWKAKHLMNSILRQQNF
jgi:hypothetical protein